MKRFFTFSVMAMLAVWTNVAAQIPLSEELVVVSNERGVNSDELEFSPVFYKDGIVFISTRHESLIYSVKDRNINGQNIMSIYRSIRNEEGFLGAPQPLADELIFRLHEGPVTFDRTANTIFFTRNEHQKQAPDGFKKLQVYAASLEGEKWGNIQKLAFNNIQYNYCHPTISPDEDVLFISSDIPGGYGGMDLYAVYRSGDGSWTQMINLGAKVNTPGNEVFPYIAADKTLYFSSDGHGGFGNLDLFYTTQNTQTDEWRVPNNLGTPFNSPFDDFGLIVDRDNKNGYFSSDRPGGFGGDDIYKFYIESQSSSPIADSGRNLDGLVILDEDGNPMEGASVSAINFRDIPLTGADGQMARLTPGDGDGNFILDVNTDGLGETAKTGTDGKADIALKKGNYVVKIAKEGYVPQYIVVTPDTDLNNLNITLQKAINCVALSGRVIRQLLNAPVSGAVVKIIDTETKEAITVYADAMGFYEYCIECNRTYSVYAEKDNVTSAPAIVSTKGVPCTKANGDIDLPLFLGGTPIYAGMNIQLPNIYFNFDDAALRPDAYKDLNEVVGLLNQYPGLKLELSSHTDSRGDRAYNQSLSFRRAQSVNRYLVGKGIASNRLKPTGYGESQIRNRCTDGVVCSEKEHQYNRRTEIKILELGQMDGAAPIAAVSEGDSYFASDVSIETERDKGGQSSDVIAVSGRNTGKAAIKPSVEKETALKDEFYKAGTYSVVAGTFANHANAVKRVSQLMEKGFLEASIVRQERNSLYAVFVQTYDTKNEAFSLVKKLDAQQIHAYVMKR